MAQPNIQYVATLNAQQVFNQLNIINNQIDKTTSEASKGFGTTGTQIGLVSGVVSSLTTEFIRLGEQAVNVLQEIVSRSVETAIQFDTLKARLGGIFDGSQEAADQAFTFIQDKSKELGIDLSELAGAFIPKTESLAQFERVAKIATALARSDPEQGAIGARIALIEALSGTFTSLQRRFEIPKEDINRLKEAFDTQGMEGFISELERVLDESGKSFDDLANTAQTSFDKLGIAGQQLGGRLGVPIVAALEEASNKILSFLNENEDDLIIFADTIGRAIADVISFISSVDLNQLNTQQLIEFGDYVFRVVDAVQLAVQQFQLLYNSISPLVNVFGTLGFTGVTLTDVFTNIDDALVTASQVLALATASFEALKVAVETTIQPYKTLIEAIELLESGDVTGAADKLRQSYDELQVALYDTSIVQDAFNKSIQESQASFAEYEKSTQDNKTAQDELRDSLEQQKNAGTDAADAIMQKAAADRQAAEDAEKLKEAQDKVNKAMADAQQDFQRKLEDIDTAYERKRTDIFLEFAQKREDAARKNLEKLADLRKKYAQELEDAETELNREEEDIARKYAQSRLDLEEETRQKRVDIETDYRRKIQDIRTQFNLDADDAEKKRDAIAFLKAIQERDAKIQEAETERQQELEDARTTEEQKRQELETQRERELEEARIHNERKLEDLKESLEREIEAQNTAYSRELEDLKISEERKLEEAKTARERDIEDAQKAYDRKLQDLEQSLADELAILKDGNAKLEEEQARHNSAMDNASKTSSPTSDTPSTGAPFRASGGPVIKGYPYIVGENGSELFVPNEDGQIVPDASGITSNPSSSTTSNYSNSKTQEITVTTDSGSLSDPIFVAKLKNIVTAELGKVL